MYFKEADERVFNIKIANTMLFEDFDIVQRAGSKYAVYDEFIEFEVDNGDLIVQGNKIKGGAKDKKIKVSFSKGRKDNPIVQGIVVYHDSI